MCHRQYDQSPTTRKYQFQIDCDPTYTELSGITSNDEDYTFEYEAALTPDMDLQPECHENDDPDFVPDRTPEGFSQCELNDLIRDLDLLKESSELLASRLGEKDLLLPGTNITFYRTRESSLLQYFSEEGDFVYCNVIESILIEMGVDKNTPDEWRLFIDSCKRSLKSVLLHNGNKYAPIPIAYSVKEKETYESVKKVLELNINGSFASTWRWFVSSLDNKMATPSIPVLSVFGTAGPELNTG